MTDDLSSPTDDLSSPAGVFEALSRRLAAHDRDAAAALYAADVVVTNRFDPSGPSTRYGRGTVREYFAGLGGRLDSLTVSDARLTPAADGETVTAEFTFAAVGPGVGRFALPAVFVLRVRDGQIVESRDHIGPRRT